MKALLTLLLKLFNTYLPTITQLSRIYYAWKILPREKEKEGKKKWLVVRMVKESYPNFL